ncbi:23S rRNA (uracil(1939)-C(5))-methyltransferase RlmD [Weissella paramesenteroides]|jgi:23S rRNA (uracil1939-C5)-methyltransferase|uniref:23S rRNA (Uracil(1939)-C(5))-methyltransferase RlmD n=1 Tax=Weissella paramesenteroides TaxID=1249 RepID=A0ABD4XIM3_WEIPA|nr:23S rRNA (uracil(1939)-C(5))-methyltransferase RlmD [Weissella paramesenteroides]KAA8439606.1 23S rRNA (uracil(1939)-C(5))-methyltransferase RlmD [Weissella paramesenteroides]KAA8441724.1 23S rRNA (uracil(1939)-C(5))-methyltransferase RlmD [Weissella paramesenteroides]KAA8444737.1 23S rRNA (uracil(1939)-C(5))-methyltransferase RlmD [Weissella paramesenteroides]KAA8445294.1 23S rRNA (uracil(1939)-C(5))-methyltransferase RlmD [Weissella paramesenteroides]KAA8446194.1 23S rRNA (uracil(1939)-C(
MSHTIMPVRLGQKLTGQVIDVLYNGFGVVMLNDYPIHMANAFPDETVTFEITQVNRKFARAEVIDVVDPSPDRLEAGKDYLLDVGIAPYINLRYEAQLKLKQFQVEKFYAAAGIDANIAPTIGMENPTHYRNKTVVPIKRDGDKLVTGFIKRRTPGEILPLSDYYVNDPVIDQTIGTVRDILNAHHISVFSDETQQGEMRYIMVRRGYYSHELMVVLVAQTATIKDEMAIANEIAAVVPGIRSVVLNHNPRALHLLMSGDNRTLWGADAIHDTLLGIEFEIGPNSFYQVNPQTTEVLYALAARKAELKPTDTVIDAYSGIGTIGLTVASQVKQVLGVEVIERAVIDAQKNVMNNQVKNATFITADAPAQMHRWQQEGLHANVIFVDPPRRGLTNELLDAVTEMRPDRFVYVSCNPATMARDAKYLIEQGFHIKGDVQPLDQFPQTAHVEVVTVFEPNN